MEIMVLTMFNPFTNLRWCYIAIPGVFSFFFCPTAVKQASDNAGITLMRSLHDQ